MKDDAAYFFLFALVAIVLTISVGFGGLDWGNGAPTTHPTTPIVHVRAATWTVNACGIGTLTGSAADARGGGRLTLGVAVGLSSVATTCAFQAVTVDTPGFSVVNGSMSLDVLENELTEIFVTLIVPNEFWTGVVVLTVVAYPLS
jgi:hypothetical protein